MKIIWSPTARADLDHVYAYISERNPRAAAGVARAILAPVERLRRFPDIGRPGQVPHTRELVIPGTPFLLPYRVMSDRVEIIAVLHGAQRWPAEK